MSAKWVVFLAFCFSITASVSSIRSQVESYIGPEIVKQPLPKPVKGADRTGLVGEIAISVSIDRNGTVLDAAFVDGPGWACPNISNPLVVSFRESARVAALSAKFRPAKRDGETVNSVEILKYEFFPRVDSGIDKKSDVRMARVVGTEGISPPDASKGALNGKAVVLPKPAYPRGAAAVRAGGTVEIQVLIDEGGAIISAEPISGHPLLRASARNAACNARFSPTLLSGQPVKVMGVVVYNFFP